MDIYFKRKVFDSMKMLRKDIKQRIVEMIKNDTLMLRTRIDIEKNAFLDNGILWCLSDDLFMEHMHMLLELRDYLDALASRRSTDHVAGEQDP